MISPQLHSESPPSCPPLPPSEAFNVSLEQTLAPPEDPPLAAATGAEFTPMSAGELAVRIRSLRAILERYRDVIAAD